MRASQEGTTALYVIAMSGFIECMQYVLGVGADPDQAVRVSPHPTNSGTE